MEWKKAKVLSENSYEIPERWLHLHYYEALNILFRVENSLRVFVYSVLKNALFDHWANIAVTPDDGEKQETISTVAKRRRQQARVFGYLGYPVSCPIMYLTGGELVRVIMSESGWKHFAAHFHGGKAVITNKLDEIAHIRNSLAYFRPISEDDVEVIRQNAKQVLMGVETYISAMHETSDVVPSNSKEDWYKSLSTIGTEDCNLRFLQSKDEEWVRIVIRFKLRMLEERRHADYHSCKVTNIVTPMILSKCPTVAKHVTFIRESVFDHVTDKEATFSKACGAAFRRSTLGVCASELRSELESLFAQVREEVELIVSDNAARGEIVTSEQVHSYRNKEHGYWTSKTASLDRDIRDNDPPEYWGKLIFSGTDFISGAEQYPSMATHISKDDSLPF